MGLIPSFFGKRKSKPAIANPTVPRQRVVKYDLDQIKNVIVGGLTTLGFVQGTSTPKQRQEALDKYINAVRHPLLRLEILAKSTLITDFPLSHFIQRARSILVHAEAMRSQIPNFNRHIVDLLTEIKSFEVYYGKQIYKFQ